MFDLFTLEYWNGHNWNSNTEHVPGLGILNQVNACPAVQEGEVINMIKHHLWLFPLLMSLRLCPAVWTGSVRRPHRARATLVGLDLTARNCAGGDLHHQPWQSWCWWWISIYFKKYFLGVERGDPTVVKDVQWVHPCSLWFQRLPPSPWHKH